MSWFSRGLTLVAGLALLLSLAVWWQSRRELHAVRGELQKVTAANEFLKKTLGEVMASIAAKDREIDRLAHTPCNEREKARPGSGSSTGKTPRAYRNAIVFTPDMSKRLRQRRFLQATLSSSSTI